MAYPLSTAIRSVGGASSPSYLTTSLSSSYVETTFTVANASSWLESVPSGQTPTNPLGTSGVFTVVVDFGTANEEHILCSGVNVSTGVVTIWTDGIYNGRGWDGTPKSAHSAQTTAPYNLNVFPFIGGTDFAAIWKSISGIRQLSSNAVTIPNLSGQRYGNYPVSTTVNVTSAVGNGLTVTYTASNSFTAGQIVSVAGMSTTSGSSLNLSSQTIVNASSTQFTIQNNTVGAGTGGTATAYNDISNQYIFADMTSAGQNGGQILLPMSPLDGTTVVVEYWNGSSTQTLIVGTQVLNGFASGGNSIVLSKVGQYATFVYNSGNALWYTVNTGYNTIATSSPLPTSLGGTGTTSFGAYGIPYADANGNLTYLAADTTNTAHFVQIKSSGGIAAAPTLISSTGTGAVVLQSSPVIGISNGTTVVQSNSGTLYLGSGSTANGSGATVNIGNANGTGTAGTVNIAVPANGTSVGTISMGSPVTLTSTLNNISLSGVGGSGINISSTSSTAINIGSYTNFATSVQSGTTMAGIKLIVPTGAISTGSYVYMPTGSPSSAPLTLATITGSEVLTNKTISGSSNTFSNIPNSATTGTSSNTASTLVLRDSSGNFSATKISLSGTPSATTDAATVGYVNSYVSANIKGWIPANYATTSALPSYTYTAGSADAEGGFGIGATLTATANGVLTVDGVAVPANALVLVKNKKDSGKSSGQSIYNGLYKLTTLGTSSVPWVLTRATTYDNSSPHMVYAGSIIYVASGNTLASQTFAETNFGSASDGSIVIGTDFIQFSPTSQNTAGNGIAISGNVISVQAGSTNTISVVSSGVNLATFGTAGSSVSNGQVPTFTTDAYGRVTITGSVAPSAGNANSLTGTTLASGVVSSSLTSVGTITSGTWASSTPVGAAYGGTGLTTYTKGLALYSDTTSTITNGVLPVVGGGTGNGGLDTALSQAGIGQPYNTGAIYLQSSRANYGAPATPSSIQYSASLPVTVGGTGTTTAPTLGAIPYGASTSALGYLAGNTTTTPKFVTSTGNGTVSSAPTLTSSTGSGSVVLSTSPSITSASLTTPTADTLSTSGTNGASASRFLGSVSGSAPSGGTYSAGDYVVDNLTGTIWIYTTSNVWTQITGGGGGGGSSLASSVVASVDLTSQASAISTTSLYTATVAGLYYINYYGKVTQVATTSSTLGNFQITSTDPDGNTVVSVGDSSSQNSLTTGFINGTIAVYVGVGGSISYSMGYASSGATPMAYNLHLTVISPSATILNASQNVAGKNPIINGAMEIWQRGTSFTSGTNAQYLADRWCAWGGWGSSTSYSASRQSVGFSGGATATSATSLTMTGAGWLTNQWAGSTVVAGSSYAVITSNTATVLTVSSWTGGTPSSTSAFTINGVSGFQYCARIQRNSGQTNTTNPFFGQSLESANSIPFAGQTVTLSFYARAGANFSGASSLLSVQLISSTGTDQNIATSYSPQYNAINHGFTLTTAWQRFTYTGILHPSTTEFAVQFNYTPTGTAGANDYYDITGVQVEFGGAASSFSRSAGTYSQELELCQRYFQVTTPVTNAMPAFVTYIGNGDTRGAVPLLKSMRVAPVITLYSGTYGTTTGANLWHIIFSNEKGAGVVNADILVLVTNVTNSQFGVAVQSSSLSTLNPSGTASVATWGMNTVNSGANNLLWSASAEI